MQLSMNVPYKYKQNQNKPKDKPLLQSLTHHSKIPGHIPKL